MKYRTIELPPLILSPNNFYLYYNDEGDILALTNEKLDDGNFIEVSEKFVIDFVESKKEIKNFKVKISDRVRLEQKKVLVRNSYDVLVVNPIHDPSSVKLLITVTGTCLHLKLNNFEDSFIVNESKVFVFYVASCKNLNFLKFTFKATLRELLDGIEIVYNFDMSNEVIVTLNEFESYGLVYDKKD
jgi:hypothetical protein